jgi:hypothetical protein
MISLSDDQLSMVMHAAEPFDPAMRPAFLAALGALLSTAGEISDGTVGRPIREVQHEFHQPLSVSRSGQGEISP